MSLRVRLGRICQVCSSPPRGHGSRDHGIPGAGGVCRGCRGLDVRIALQDCRDLRETNDCIAGHVRDRGLAQLRLPLRPHANGLAPQFHAKMGRAPGSIRRPVPPYVDLLPALVRRELPGTAKPALADRVFKTRDTGRVRLPGKVTAYTGRRYGPAEDSIRLRTAFPEGSSRDVEATTGTWEFWINEKNRGYMQSFMSSLIHGNMCIHF